MPRPLLTPVFEGGSRSTHFFEGRLLSAKDLRDEQEAVWLRDRRVGRGVGAGIVEGLDVRVEAAGGANADPVLAVTAGLAINANGGALELPQDQQFTLTRGAPAPTGDGEVFSDCRSAPSLRVPTGEGLYVVVMSPVSRFEERAPRSGLGVEGRVVGCGSRYRATGVRFRLEPLDAATLDAVPAAIRETIRDRLLGSLRAPDVSLLRNLAAHACLGSFETPGHEGDPFRRIAKRSPFIEYGAADALAGENALTRCDVPLALIYWTSRGVLFADRWALRRRSVPPPASIDWVPALGIRRRAEAEARFFQFQDHVEALARESTTFRAAVKARTWFRLLPPAGIVPIDDGNTSRGMGLATFFERVKVRRDSAGNPHPLFVDAARVQSLIERSTGFPPIDLEEEELIWLYFVRQNRDGERRGDGGRKQAAVVFTSGFMPFAADAQYDLARWNFSNYGPGIAGQCLAGE